MRLRLPGESAGRRAVVSFLTAHLGYPIPSRAIFDKIRSAFQRAVSRFAEDEHIPVVRFHQGRPQIEKLPPYLAAQPGPAGPGGSNRGCAGVRQRVTGTKKKPGRTGCRGFLRQGRSARQLLLLLPLG